MEGLASGVQASRVVLQLESDSVVPLEIVEMMGDAYVDVGLGGWPTIPGGFRDAHVLRT